MIMAKKTIEERVEDIELWQHKMDGYGKIAIGFVAACSIMAGFFNWLVDKYLKIVSH
jgi:hypothetical protein